METSAEVLKDNRVKVAVTVDEATVVARFKKQYKQVAGQYNFPGFRRGKAPRAVIDNALGKEAVAAQVTDDLVNETCGRAMDDNGLFPVAKPEFDAEVALAQDGKSFSYAFEVAVKPSFELNSYDALSFAMPAEGASDKEVDAEIAALQEHYYDIVDAPANTKIKEDNYADLSIKATDDAGNDIESISSDSRQYGLGSGLFPKSFDDELLGLKKGDSKQFSIDVPAEPTVMTGSLIGKTEKIAFDVTVIVVKKKKAVEMTDEWIKETFGLEGVDDLRKNISESIAAQKAAILPRLKENRALAALAERLEGDAPENMVEAAEAQLVQDFFQQLQAQGLTFDAYLASQNLTSQQFRDDLKKQAADTVKQDLALDAWAVRAGLEVTDEDISAEFAKSGAEDPAAVEKSWREAGQIHMVRQGVLRQKALDNALESAVITEEVVEDKPAKKAAAKKSSKKKGAEPASDAE